MEKKKGGTCFSTHRLRRNGNQLNHYSVPNSQYSFTKKKKKEWNCLLDHKENLNYCDCTIHIRCPGSILKIISKGGLEKNTLTTLAHHGSAKKRPSNGYFGKAGTCHVDWSADGAHLDSLHHHEFWKEAARGTHCAGSYPNSRRSCELFIRGRRWLFSFISYFSELLVICGSLTVCACVCVCARVHVHAHAPTHLSLPFRLNSNINLWCNIFAPHQNGKDELQRSNWVERIKKMTSLQTWTCQKRILLSAPLCDQPGTLNSPWPAACCPCFISFDHHLFYVTIHNIPREYMCVLHLCTF